MESKNKSSDGVQIEVRNYADQQNLSDTPENSAPAAPAYKKKIDADAPVLPQEDIDDDTTADKSVIKINGINRKRQKTIFSPGKSAN